MVALPQQEEFRMRTWKCEILAVDVTFGLFREAPFFLTSPNTELTKAKCLFVLTDKLRILYRQPLHILRVNLILLKNSITHLQQTSKYKIAVPQTRH